MFFYDILENELGLFVCGDIITTITALHFGAFETNQIPARLMSINSGIWIAGLIGILISCVIIGRCLNRKYNNKIGVLIFPVPVLIEISAVLNNIGVIRTLI